MIEFTFFQYSFIKNHNDNDLLKYDLSLIIIMYITIYIEGKWNLMKYLECGKRTTIHSVFFKVHSNGRPSVARKDRQVLLYFLYFRLA